MKKSRCSQKKRGSNIGSCPQVPVVATRKEIPKTPKFKKYEIMDIGKLFFGIIKKKL
jgi:hypothetical protein